ncbi:MAG: aspartate kinase [Chloroflexi bacterium]|nr:aspartate kinase [Chloroflexota bacterium]
MQLTMKFGGTSVGSAAAIRRTVELVGQQVDEGHQVVVVVSAMGIRPVKVTDLLLQGAHAAVADDAEKPREIAALLRQVHQEAIAGVVEEGELRQALLAEIDAFVRRFSDLCGAVRVLGELTPRALDAIAGMGEQMAARIVAAALQTTGRPAAAVDATALIVTDAGFQDATPLVEETASHIEATLPPLLAANTIPVVTGFIAATPDGITTTLGRGGSDYTAALLGRALASDEVWIWTDVDGVMSADPRLVPEAHTIRALTYREVGELAYYGARVLHPRTIRPCVEAGIPLRIKNTFHPENPGTLIVADGSPVAGNGAMKAVTAIGNQSLISLEGNGMLGIPGIAARTFSAVARQGVNVLLISQASSEQSICFSVPGSSATTVIGALEDEFAGEFRRRDMDRVWALEPVAIVTVVGAGMRGTPGIAGRLFSALGNAGINIIAIAQGSSECSISLVVDEADTRDAVQEIHNLLQVVPAR